MQAAGHRPQCTKCLYERNSILSKLETSEEGIEILLRNVNNKTGYLKVKNVRFGGNIQAISRIGHVYSADQYISLTLMCAPRTQVSFLLGRLVSRKTLGNCV